MDPRNSFGVLLLLALVCPHLASRQVVDQGLSDLFTELWRLDINRMAPGSDYNISVQGRAGYIDQGSHNAVDHASSPLFSGVDEQKLQGITTFSRFVKLLDNYERSTGVSERVSAAELTENSLFLDAVLQTEVMKRAHRYLVEKGKSSSNLQAFKTQLNTIWFRLYHRDRAGGEDSCGFEHVFVGETKHGREIVGLHNWVQLYMQEKIGKLDYKGYRAGSRDLPDQDDHVLNLQFSWHGLVKPVGGAFVGVSPEFELAVYSVVFLLDTGRRSAVLVNVDECQLEVVVIRHGRSLGTAYPRLLSSNRRHL